MVPVPSDAALPAAHAHAAHGEAPAHQRSLPGILPFPGKGTVERYSTEQGKNSHELGVWNRQTK